MISPSPADFYLAGLNVVNRSIPGPVGVSLSYRQSRSPAIRVFLISFFAIPYFPKKKGTQMAPREKRAFPGFRAGARR